ncbi:MAG: sigma-54-dependent transcriptional regulator [Lewinella sp.]|jgi:DNA-binding NtrC family response regulator|uniref:sigma-54-dependent transcriptional regulator n=1 Tax=Lewinella sp. TaxID=2004506 RepID=UPI003D6AC13E
MPRVLVVDDEAAIRRALRDILEFEKYDVVEATNGTECLVKLKQGKFDVIVLDIKMPQMDGMDALDRIGILSPETPVIMISGHADIDTAVESVRKGAFDFISKPLDLNRLLITLRNALDKSTLIGEKKALQKKVNRKEAPKMIGKSEGLTKILATIEKVAPTEARILITGPNGTGKELVARQVHKQSSRAKKALIEVNCAAIPTELIESELFGHEKGSFTGAAQQKSGKFEQADKGTLFLDEIGDMSLSAQAKVLRALQENQITRVGGTKDLNVDVRVLAATNKDLRVEIAAGRFREDLYHRLSVILIEVPALNDRRDDIPLLIDHFNRQICKEYGVVPKKWEDKVIAQLQELNWTGNIRELRNVVERLLILSNDSVTLADVQQFVLPSAAAPAKADSLQQLFQQFDTLEDLQVYIQQEYQEHQPV